MRGVASRTRRRATCQSALTSPPKTSRVLPSPSIFSKDGDMISGIWGVFSVRDKARRGKRASCGPLTGIVASYLPCVALKGECSRDIFVALREALKGKLV